VNTAKRLTIIFEVQAMLLLWPRHALAHPMKGVGDFYAGMLHPVTAIDSVLPMIALGLLAGQQCRRTAIGILASFPVAIFIGSLLGLIVPVSTDGAIMETAVMAVLGIFVAANWELPIQLAVGLSAVLGIAIGWANGGELGPETSVYRFIPGEVLVSLLLISYGIGLVRRITFPWAKIAFRVAGSWIAAIGILILGLK
jgi:urease accessory protein